jgi:hypothetical protein
MFSSPRRPDWLLGPSNLLSNRYQGLLPGVVKRPGSEAVQSSLASPEAKKMWIYIFSPP